MTSTDTRCTGCGTSFKGDRGLRAHQNSRFVAMGCRPVAPSPEEKAVESITGPELLRTFAHLTHRIGNLARHGDTGDADRAKRDLVEAEILRRMGDR